MTVMTMALMPFVSLGQEKDVNVRTDFQDYIYVSGDAGLMFMNGQIDKIKPTFNCRVGLGYQMINVLGFKFNVGAGLLKGEFDNGYKSNGDYYSADFNITVNLTDIILGYNPARKFNVTPHFGVGVLELRSALKDENDDFIVSYGEKGLGKEAYNVRGKGIMGRENVFTVPVGLSVGYQLTQSWGLYADWTYYFADSDKLDAVVVTGHDDRSNSINLGATYRIKESYNPFTRHHEFCNNWYVMFEGGVMSPFGDVSSSGTLKPNFGIGGGYRFHNIFNIYAKIHRGEYEGDFEHGGDYDGKILSGEYYNASVNFSFDLVGAILGYRENRPIAVSPHAGIGLINYKNEVVLGGQHYFVGYKGSGRVEGNGICGMEMAMSVPVGIEVAYNMTKRWDAYVDATYTYVGKDNFDGYDMGSWNDGFGTANFGLRYKFRNTCERNDDLGDEKPLPQMSAYDSIPAMVKKAVKEAIEEGEIMTNTVQVEKAYFKCYTDIQFPVSKAERIDSQANRDAIARACSEMGYGSKLIGIVVEGYASPEGESDNNQKLSEDRAREAAAFIKSEIGRKVKMGDAKIETVGMGADWEGLILAIANEKFEGAEEVANELRDADNGSRPGILRKAMAKYPQIRYLFPQLRRATVTIKTVKEE